MELLPQSFNWTSSWVGIWTARPVIYNSKHGVDELCRQVHSGGGRLVAVGINQLTSRLLVEFTEQFFLKFVRDIGA
jgi:hypothetical protein